jgi:hypothetical protein
MRETLFDMLAAGRFVRWDEEAADCLLRDTLRRVALGFKNSWRTRLAEESRDWLLVEAAVDTAALTHDMATFIRAVAAYEQYVCSRFEVWELEDRGR